MRDRLTDLKKVLKLFTNLKKIYEKKGLKIDLMIDELTDTTSQKMKEYLAAISLVKNYIKSLERIIESLKKLKKINETALGSEADNNSKKIEEEINRGMNIQNSSNILMKNITELLKNLKEDVSYNNLFKNSIFNIRVNIYKLTF